MAKELDPDLFAPVILDLDLDLFVLLIWCPALKQTYSFLQRGCFSCLFDCPPPSHCNDSGYC